MMEQPPKIYGELADWFHLLTAPEEYGPEAEFYLARFTEAIGHAPHTLLELGSGGGNMASHYKRHVTATLVDVSLPILAVSKRINPECEHLQGDMRTVRLGRVFDAVLVHDAACYMRTLADLHAAFATALVHCRPGGVALFAPDHIRENFAPQTDHGGHDGVGRSLRYLEWTTDPNPDDDTYTTDYACMLHESGKPTRAVLDTHVCGLFSAAQWEQGIKAAGFDPVTRTAGPMEPGYDYTIFIGVRTR